MNAKLFRGWVVEADDHRYSLTDGERKLSLTLTLEMRAALSTILSQGNLVAVAIPSDPNGLSNVEVTSTDQVTLISPSSNVVDVASLSGDDKLKWRFLDNRVNGVLANLKLKSALVHHVMGYFAAREFTFVETPVLTRSIGEYTSEEFTVSAGLLGGKRFSLNQSPQIFKQLLMASGIRRYYQIARNFRAEPGDSTHLQEFTQIDAEIAYITQEEILEFLEEYISAVFLEFANVRLHRPFCRYDYKEVMEKFGVDNPDLLKTPLANDPRFQEEVKSGFFPFFLVNFPYAARKPSGAVEPVHHVMSQPFNRADIYDPNVDLTNMLCSGYDLMINGVEIAGGDVRINNYEDQHALLVRLGYPEEKIKELYDPLLRALAHGTPPHGGFAIGLDRLLMMLTRETEISRTLAFPKTPDCRCPLTSSPT